MRRVLVVLIALLSVGRPAFADDPNLEARAAFVEATELVKHAQWGEALAAFERANALRPHAVTTFDIAACERAIGHLTRARAAFRKALADEKQLPASLREEATGYLTELDRQLAIAVVHVTPEDSLLLVDGRPLEADEKGDLVAGLAPPGPGTPVPAGELRITLDPGLRVLTFARKGFLDATVRRELPGGVTTEMTLALDRLPATLHIESNIDGALVTLNGEDLGPVPIDVRRPAGDYRVHIMRRGFVAYDAQVSAHPGESISMRAPLHEDKPGLLTRWWFWTAAGVLVTGAAVGTYYATRPAPSRPAVGGGSLGWTANIP